MHAATWDSPSLPTGEPGLTSPCPSEDASWLTDLGRVLNSSFPPCTPSLASGVKGLTAGTKPREQPQAPLGLRLHLVWALLALWAYVRAME